MEQLLSSGSQIQYNLISTNRSYNIAPFNQQALNLLRELPIDLMQLNDSIEFFNFNFRFNSNIGLALYALPCDMFQFGEAKLIFDEYKKLFASKSIIQVFIIDGTCNHHKKISEFINSFPLSYFSVIPEQSDFIKHYNSEKYFSDSIGFISLLRRDKELINSEISSFYSEEHRFEFSINSEKTFFNLNPSYRSNLTETNTYILNQIIGNKWLEIKSKEILIENEDREKTIISQINNLDKFTELMLYGKIAQPITAINPQYAPLILTCPHHFPHDKHFKSDKPTSKERAFWQVSLSEQRFDYCFEIDDKYVETLGKEATNEIMAKIQMKLIFLDLASYLHAVFTHSPVYRLRLIGKSIRGQLSNTIGNKANIKSIQKLGKEIETKLYSSNFKELVKEKNRQIVAISDLPIEWSFIDNIPLSFTHDICRLPELNSNSIINNYIHNQRSSYSIPTDIVSKTLIIHCASETDTKMHDMFKVIDDFKIKIGFNSVFCKSVDEIVNALNKFKPDFLIFDCHGDSKEEDLSTYLIIDEAKKIYLSGDEIISKGISAPIVFISACNTMPNNGYVKFLSDAFFQAGAYVVTATFLPLSIKDAGVLIVRILNSLKVASVKVIHSNWLEFLSHTLRKALIHEAIMKKCAKKGYILNEKNHLDIGKLLTDLMLFNKRREIFETLDEKLKNILPFLQFDFKNLENEWLYYTTIGRADLIYFEKWLNEYRVKNLGSDNINCLPNPAKNICLKQINDTIFPNYNDTTKSFIDNNLSVSKIIVYPNPCKGNFYIEIPDAIYKNASLEIFSLNGQKIFETTIFENNQNIIFTNKQGVYILNLINGTNIYTEKIILK